MTPLFSTIVVRGLALTAVLHGGAACAERAVYREGHVAPMRVPCVSGCLVTGTVRDAAGAAVAGALVEVAGARTESDAEGRYVLEVTTGEVDHRLVVTPAGGALVRVELVLEAGGRTQDVVLP